MSIKSDELPCAENLEPEPKDNQSISEKSSEHLAESENEVEIVHNDQ